MDRSLPGSSLQGILQARIVKWVVISFSRESSQSAQPKDGSGKVLPTDIKNQLVAVESAG